MGFLFEKLQSKQEERKYVVYKHTSPSGKSYIGITNKKPERRWGKSGYGYLNQNNKHFANAIQKYGWKNFQHEILNENLSSKQAKELERFYIEKFDCFGNGYNSTLGGDGGGFIGRKHTDESKEKISKAFLGRFVGELNPMYGSGTNHICDENGHLPKHIRDKLVERGKERFQDGEFATKMQQYNIDKMRKVNQYDLEGTLIATYDHFTQAGELSGICKATIHKCCNRNKIRDSYQSKTAGGYQWRYADDCEDIGKISSTFIIRKVVQLDLNEDYLNVFNNASDAARKTSSCMSSIIKTCKKEQKTSGGYRWMYYEDYIKQQNQETAS